MKATSCSSLWRISGDRYTLDLGLVRSWKAEKEAARAEAESQSLPEIERTELLSGSWAEYLIATRPEQRSNSRATQAMSSPQKTHD